jgi:hypothetical protein
VGLVYFRFFSRFVGFGVSVLGKLIPTFSYFPKLLKHGLLFFMGFGLLYFLDGRHGDLLANNLHHHFAILDILFDQKVFNEFPLLFNLEEFFIITFLTARMHFELVV